MSHKKGKVRHSAVVVALSLERSRPEHDAATAAFATVTACNFTAGC